MKAIRIHRFGGPKELKLEEVSLPVPKPGEVLIEVRAASVNPVDTKIRKGIFRLFKPRLPAVIGRDIAGIVRAVGCPHHASSYLSVGDAVFGMIDYDRGAYAGFTIASERELAIFPSGLKWRDAGVLGVAALTAWQGLFDCGKLKSGQRVLIHGGAGGVGHLAVQFAKHRGATVIATAGARDLAWVRSLGAHRVIDHKNEKFENEVGNVDLVFDLIGGDTQQRSWQTLKERGGIVVSTLSDPSRMAARLHRARGYRMVVHADSAQLNEIGRLVAAGKVRVKIGKVFPLAQTWRAHALIETGHVRGKIALKV